MRLSEMLSGLPGANVIRDCDVTGVTYDSRLVEPGFAFVAVTGTRLDGHFFVPGAIQAGAGAVIAERDVPVPAHIGFATVVDDRKALSWVSMRFYDHPSRELLVAGVTGTKGKTTTCHLLKHVLDAAGEVTGLISTAGNLVGSQEKPVTRTTPESSDLQRLLREMVQAGCSAAVVEVSSHALSLSRVGDVLFDVAVLTNIGRDHLDFHLTMEDYVAAKGRLFNMVSMRTPDKTRVLPSVSIINMDDAHYSEFASLAATGLVTYGLSDDALIRAGDIRPDQRGSSLSLFFGRRKEEIRLSFPGAFNVYNALAAAAAGFGLGLPVDAIVQGLESARGVKGRAQLIDEAKEFAVVVDYAHTPESLGDILSASREVGQGRLIGVFGCGGDRDKGKRPLMGKIAGDLCDLVVITNDNPRTEDEEQILDEIEEGLRGSSQASYLRIKDRREAIFEAIERARPGDTVVIAGKGHETSQTFKDKIVHFDDAEVAREAILTVTGAKKVDDER